LNSLFLGLVAISLSIGQLLFKSAGLAVQGRPLVSALLALFLLPTFYVALSIYGVATLMWIYVLSRVPLTEAYPWIMAATVSVPLIGRFYFDERVGPTFWIGIALVALGLLLTQIGASR
jgi:drug/metabolite transporter (DMT)-like permease